MQTQSNGFQVTVTGTAWSARPTLPGMPRVHLHRGLAADGTWQRSHRARSKHSLQVYCRRAPQAQYASIGLADFSLLVPRNREETGSGSMTKVSSGIVAQRACIQTGTRANRTTVEAKTTWPWITDI